MNSFIYTLIAFIVLIGILVTVHEFGHYWVARYLGVKILRFSIGFGKPLWLTRFGKDNTEFAISAIPLGGYVKMLDETEGEVTPTDLPRAFNRQSLKVRTAIVVAGPLFNFLLAIIAFMGMYLLGITGMRALVGEVTPHSLAEQAGFESGYEIVAVNTQPTLRWETVIQSTLTEILDEQIITYSVRAVIPADDASSFIKKQREDQYDVVLDLNHLSIDDLSQGQFFEAVGIKPLRLPALLGEVEPGSAAMSAGLRVGDKIVTLDNQPVEDWRAWAEYIAEHPDVDIRTEVDRGGERLFLVLRPANIDGKGYAGVRISEDYFSTERYGLGMAFLRGITKTWETSVLTVRLLGKMLMLQLSPKNISGPISIAQYAGYSAQRGFFMFLYFLGLVSVSLAIINLFPIPLLDGGHLLLYLLEAIKGGPVTENTQFLLQRVGLTLLLSLMGLAIFNDLERLFS
ncbi:MAG: RIP metalloprotease RseP [Beggiatoa sp. IS2]|nr:MAG: RIP metalloprotease RseP [Beggiatoa sp. IS2]